MVTLADNILSNAQTRYTIEYQEAFALFDKRGTSRVPRESLGELLRSLGQNPTQREVADLQGKVGGTCECWVYIRLFVRRRGCFDFVNDTLR
jgi:Ca2+-binding EF-hand superfamily protein